MRLAIIPAPCELLDDWCTRYTDADRSLAKISLRLCSVSFLLKVQQVSCREN